ncbi:hypothetical protein ICW40_05490 [Actinotalea ferrariae]|uniref:hypothetical protein n=1 Tax=Actinotalea ferrariae TaxID=1386098 RepID=UPI001C8BF6B5|nr:hypothetical protein [Actinotalea ferrariae]MBX9244259.1 hypothetical protein [Actinotalea ferrariae]
MDRRRLRPVIAAATLPLLLTLGACSSDNDVNSFSSGFDLAHDDPMGFVACRDLVAAERADGDERDDLMDAVAASAASSESEPIRSTVDPPVSNADSERIGPDMRGRFTVDADALREGCEQSGFDFEDVTDNDDEGVEGETSES